MADDRKRALPRLARSLSARLLVLTIVFVMLAEFLIYAPSLANFRTGWLEEKVAAALLATQVLEATPPELVTNEMKVRLLASAGAHAVVLRRPQVRLLLSAYNPPPIDLTVTLGERSLLGQVGDAFLALVQSENRIIRLQGPQDTDIGLTVEVVLDELPLRHEMLIYSRNILLLSLVISAITGALLYFTLQWMMVRPMRAITEGVTEFARNPEDATAGLQPTTRRDEIGVAQSVLVDMQKDLRASLRQKNHLAALGSAVSKINHDLRGILSTAVLMSDRLARVDDPDVKRIAPALVQSIDRAINLCTQTLSFARDEGSQLQCTRFRLANLVDEVAGDLAALRSSRAPIANAIDDDLVVEADRDQLYRVFANLARNAIEAGAKEVRVSVTNSADMICIDVADDGPGIPHSVRENLFKAFSGTARAGGTGLGLAITRDVMRAHGGDIALVVSGDDGTLFRLELPKQG